MQDLQSRRSILRKGAKATVAAAGVAGLAGNAAAYSDYGISIIHESGTGSGFYEVRVPYGGSSWEVSKGSNTEDDDALTLDDQNQEVVLTGGVSSSDGGDYWTTKNTGKPYVADSSNCSITIA